MDTSSIIGQLSQHLSVFNVILIILLVGDEIMGANNNVKASSWYGLVKALIMTLVDQVRPQTPTPPSNTSGS